MARLGELAQLTINIGNPVSFQCPLTVRELKNKYNSYTTVIQSGLNKLSMINNGKRTKWCTIRSVIIRVINKIDCREAGTRFVNHKYD